MVKLFTRPSCGKCPTTKYWLRQKGISYEEVNIDNDPTIEQRIYDSLGYILVPTVEIDGQIIGGLDFQRLTEALKV